MREQKGMRSGGAVLGGKTQQLRGEAGAAGAAAAFDYLAPGGGFAAGEEPVGLGSLPFLRLIRHFCHNKGN